MRIVSAVSNGNIYSGSSFMLSYERENGWGKQNNIPDGFNEKSFNEISASSWADYIAGGNCFALWAFPARCKH